MQIGLPQGHPLLLDGRGLIQIFIMNVKEKTVLMWSCTQGKATAKMALHLP